ncbi:hypothetical protein T265_07816 [Opisthorchis viverrini]|uniref:C2H2-type domain-containing protein n=1 Tax=Opisthorchis viverrini TaxID=6198 RepID=A0A074ZFX0_OPIVI|nr:hypothetical protein T265_07816 [Opisthorchis viverrini]KER24547.1 hypothetical protein T265_07816 [Opisthorchis viverrini]
MATKAVRNRTFTVTFALPEIAEQASYADHWFVFIHGDTMHAKLLQRWDLPDRLVVLGRTVETAKQAAVKVPMPRFKVTPQTQKIHEDSSSPTEDEDDDEFPGDEFVEQTVKQTDEDLSSSSQDLTSSLSALAGVTPSGCTPNMQIAALLAQAAATMAAMGSGTNLPLPQAMQPLIAPLGLSLPSLPKPVPEPMMINAKTAVKYKPVTPISGPSLPLNRSAQLPRMPMGILIAKSRPRAWTVQKPLPKSRIPTPSSIWNSKVQKTMQQTVATPVSSSPIKKAVQALPQRTVPKVTPPGAVVSLSSTAEQSRPSLVVTAPTTKPGHPVIETNSPKVGSDPGFTISLPTSTSSPLSVCIPSSKPEPQSIQKALTEDRNIVVPVSQPATVNVKSTLSEPTNSLEMIKAPSPCDSSSSSLCKPAPLTKPEQDPADSPSPNRPQRKSKPIPAVPKPPPIDVGIIPLPAPPKVKDSKPMDKKRCRSREHVQCPVCSKLLRRSSLTEHMEMHNNGGRFSCPVCSKKFSRASGREKHLRVHTGEKPFKCPHCPKAYRQQIHLNEHLRSHSGERPFVCRLCGFALSSRSQLTRHIRTHGVQKKPAEVPELWFKSDAPKETVLGLAAEVGRVLDEKDEKPNNQKTSKGKSRVLVANGTEENKQQSVDLAKLSRKCLCNACPAGFPTIQALRSHRQFAHGGTYPHKCRECGEAFASVKLRQAHYQAKHPHICPFCSMAMSHRRPGVLEAHIRDCHPDEERLEPDPVEKPPSPQPSTYRVVEVATRQLRSTTKRVAFTDDSVQIPKWKRFRPDKVESDTSSEEEEDGDSQSDEQRSGDSEYVSESKESVSSDEPNSKARGKQGEDVTEASQVESGKATEDHNTNGAENLTNSVENEEKPTLAENEPEPKDVKTLPALFFFVQNIAPPSFSEPDRPTTVAAQTSPNNSPSQSHPSGFVGSLSEDPATGAVKSCSISIPSHAPELSSPRVSREAGDIHAQPHISNASCSTDPTPCTVSEIHSSPVKQNIRQTSMKENNNEDIPLDVVKCNGESTALVRGESPTVTDGHMQGSLTLSPIPINSDQIGHSLRDVASPQNDSSPPPSRATEPDGSPHVFDTSHINRESICTAPNMRMSLHNVDIGHTPTLSNRHDLTDVSLGNVKDFESPLVVQADASLNESGLTSCSVAPSAESPVASSPQASSPLTHSLVEMPDGSSVSIQKQQSPHTNITAPSDPDTVCHDMNTVISAVADIPPGHTTQTLQLRPILTHGPFLLDSVDSLAQGMKTDENSRSNVAPYRCTPAMQFTRSRRDEILPALDSNYGPTGD